MNGELLCLAKAGLHLDEPLAVRFTRCETDFFVADCYKVDIERETDVFNAFIRVRNTNEETEAEIDNRPIMNQDTDTIEYADIERLTALLCEGPAVATQARSFMARFDPHCSGYVTRSRFHSILQEECDFLKLSFFERLFLTFDEPSTSRLSLYTAVAVMILILISSVGFVLATESQFLENSSNTDEPPREMYALRVLEAYCMIAFTVEYLCRGLTVWAVRLYLRETFINFTIIKKKSVVPVVLEDLPELPKPAGLATLSENKKHITSTPTTPDPASTQPSRRQSVVQWLTRTVSSIKPSIKVEPGDVSVLSVELQLEALHPSTKHSGLKRTWRYLTTTMNTIDAIAIAPFYLEIMFGVGGGGLGFLRILRLARVFRLFKFGHLNEGVTLLGNVIRQSYPSLKLLAFFALIGCVLYGSIIFLCEQGSWHGPSDDGDEGVWMRPNALGTDTEMTPFLSIPRSMWWVMVTATTVGYGDMVPTTSLGKVVASLTMLSGVLVLALPITIISSNFTNEYEKLEELKSEQRLAKANSDMHMTMLNVQEVIDLFDAQDPRDEEWELLRNYQGNIVRRLERHFEMLLRGSRVISLIGKLEARGAVSEASCVAVTREILSLMYKACAKGNAQHRSKSGDLTDGANSMESGDVDAAVQVVMMWFRRMFTLDARKQSSLHGTPSPLIKIPPNLASQRKDSEVEGASTHKGRRGSWESNLCSAPSPLKRRRSQPSLFVSPVHGSSKRASMERVHREQKTMPIPVFGEKDPMECNEKSKSADSVLFGVGQFPTQPPNEEEEHELRIAFMSFIVKVIPPVSTRH